MPHKSDMLKCELDGMLAKECAVKCELANRVIRSETRIHCSALTRCLLDLIWLAHRGCFAEWYQCEARPNLRVEMAKRASRYEIKTAIIRNSAKTT
jgi:hypothetical protein